MLTLVPDKKAEMYDSGTPCLQLGSAQRGLNLRAEKVVLEVKLTSSTAPEASQWNG
jgi:hypothetical protein